MVMDEYSRVSLDLFAEHVGIDDDGSCMHGTPVLLAMPRVEASTIAGSDLDVGSFCRKRGAILPFVLPLQHALAGHRCSCLTWAIVQLSTSHVEYRSVVPMPNNNGSTTWTCS